MEEVKRLSAENVPTLRRVWIHNNDVVGLDEDGEPLILARLEGNEGAHGDVRITRKRPPRKSRAKAASAPGSETSVPEE